MKNTENENIIVHMLIDCNKIKKLVKTNYTNDGLPPDVANASVTREINALISKLFGNMRNSIKGENIGITLHSNGRYGSQKSTKSIRFKC